MKKYIYLLLCLSITAVTLAADAQTYRRKVKQPEFFIPSSAKSNTAEQNPPLNNVIQQQLYHRLGVMPQSPQQKTPQAPKTNIKQPTSNIKSANTAPTQQQSVAKKNVKTPVEPQKTAKHPNPAGSTASAPTKKIQPQEIPAKVIDTKQPESLTMDAEKETPIVRAPSVDSNNPFKSLWDDYQRDLQAISNKQPIKNPNLDKIISDFINFEHVL